MIVYPKEVIIATLRDLFSKDDYYHYSKDQFGFANTTDHTDLPLGSDIPTSHNTYGTNQEGLTTRLFIGENYRYDGIYYPAILVKSGGSKYVPISINREDGSVEYEDILYVDGYGNETVVHKPAYFINAGVWEGSIVIDINTRSLRSRDDLVEIVANAFTGITFNTLEDIGIVVKPAVISSPSEVDDRNDKLFKQTITFDIRTEWRIKKPVTTIIDAILFTVEFQDIDSQTAPVAANLTINTELSLTDLIIGQ
jgi:hypothetical protein